MSNIDIIKWDYRGQSFEQDKVCGKKDINEG